MPKVTEITVSSGRVLPHPHESYANLRPSLSLKASLEDGESVEDAALILQVKAEILLEAHIGRIEERIEAEYQAKRSRQEEEYERHKVERAARVPVAELVEEEDEDEHDEQEF
jgi:hypothetical protein